MSNILYTYGTLRPGGPETISLKGQMYDLGWFPGVKLGGSDYFVCEKVEVEDWGRVDAYEGYFPDDPGQSLYIRRPILDGYIYEFNRDINPAKIIQSGDWLDYRRQHV